jgi:copper chaperone
MEVIFMENITLKVTGMSCEHCVKAVKNASTDVPGVSDAEVSLEAGTVKLTYDGSPDTLAAVRAAIREEEYDVE